ncbi:TetR/AcrR family transcriptional regulator [Flavobacterium rhizosphaerae]|uniref:TetR/AcrR family transcriptional regulator n=1 Tax=Flavobacterium rhizosphaerae TaxID=3163298 RepID=A0ABW8YT54_9FLAO
MKEAILDKATEMYMKMGLKGVTLDDIAQEMGISKKTIYQHFSNKNSLVEAVCMEIVDTIKCNIDNINASIHDPMEELFEIRRYVKQTVEGKYQLIIYQLNRFFPEIAQKLRSNQFDKMYTSVKSNIERGMAMGLYRKELDKEFISRIYFIGVSSTKDNEIFHEELFNIGKTTNLFLEYHLRAICTPKGIALLERYLKEKD